MVTKYPNLEEKSTAKKATIALGTGAGMIAVGTGLIPVDLIGGCLVILLGLGVIYYERAYING